MGRGSKREELFRIRVRDDHSGKPKSALITSSNGRKVGERARNPSRIISVSKVSREEVLKTGEYWKMGDILMKEFARERQLKAMSNTRPSPSILPLQTPSKEISS